MVGIQPFAHNSYAMRHSNRSEVCGLIQECDFLGVVKMMFPELNHDQVVRSVIALQSGRSSLLCKTQSIIYSSGYLNNEPLFIVYGLWNSQ